MAFEIDPELLGLVDEVALVVGGGGIGMGRAHCRQLARAGCHIVVADMDAVAGKETVKEVEAIGRNAVFVEGDAADFAQVDRMVQTAFDAFGRLDVAVNHAGGGGDGVSIGGRFLEITDKAWETILRRNLISTAICCRAEARAMIERQTPGRIINVSSNTGVLSAPLMSAYGAAKAGVIHLTRTLAVEFGPHNIRVNCIIPGFHPNPKINVSREHQDRYALATPLRRNGSPMETGGLAVLFASKLTSFVTGQALASDGGITAAPGAPDPPGS